MCNRLLFSNDIKQNVENSSAQSHVLGDSYVIRHDTWVGINLCNILLHVDLWKANTIQCL